jgi:hypothetical protein
MENESETKSIQVLIKQYQILRNVRNILKCIVLSNALARPAGTILPVIREITCLKKILKLYNFRIKSGKVVSSTPLYRKIIELTTLVVIGTVSCRWRPQQTFYKAFCTSYW